MKFPFEIAVLFTTGAVGVDDCTTLMEPSLFNCQARPGPGVEGENVNEPETLLAENTGKPSPADTGEPLMFTKFNVPPPMMLPDVRTLSLLPEPFNLMTVVPW